MKYKITMPIELLVPFLTQLNVSIDLSITLHPIFVTGDEFNSLFSKKILCVNEVFEEIVHAILQVYRSWIFKICFLFESEAVNSLPMLRNTVVTTVEDSEFYIIAQFFKNVMYNMPCPALIVIKQTSYIFKQENFRLGFFYHAGKFIK